MPKNRTIWTGDPAKKFEGTRRRIRNSDPNPSTRHPYPIVKIPTGTDLHDIGSKEVLAKWTKIMLVALDKGALESAVNCPFTLPVAEIINGGRPALVITLTRKAGTGQVVGPV